MLKGFAEDMESVCPNAWFLNYTNPMAMLTGFMLRYTKIKTVGLCHSVQACSRELLKKLDMEDKIEGRVDRIAGINHMAWLLSLQDKDGNDLYPEIKKRAKEKNAREKHEDMVRFDYIDKLGELDTSNVEPMSHAFKVQNVFREDEVTNGDDRENILKNAPEEKDGSFVVPRTFD